MACGVGFKSEPSVMLDCTLTCPSFPAVWRRMERRAAKTWWRRSQPVWRVLLGHHERSGAWLTGNVSLHILTLTRSPAAAVATLQVILKSSHVDVSHEFAFNRFGLSPPGPLHWVLHLPSIPFCTWHWTEWYRFWWGFGGRVSSCPPDPPSCKA